MAMLLLLPVLIVSVCLWSFWTYGIVRKNRFVLWLGLLLVGLAVVMSGELEVGFWEKWLVTLWGLSVLGLPLWWFSRDIRKAWHR
jgi:hypothetical protein